VYSLSSSPRRGRKGRGERKVEMKKKKKRRRGEIKVEMKRSRFKIGV